MTRILSIALLVVATASAAPPPKPTPGLFPKEKAESWIKDRLKDPKSYEPIGWSQYFASTDSYKGAQWHDAKITVKAMNSVPLSRCPQCDHVYEPYQVWGFKYRARNSFGGYNLEEQMFLYDAKGQLVPYK